MSIYELDEERFWVKIIIQELCKIDYDSYSRNPKILTREILESRIFKILTYFKQIKQNLVEGKPSIYGLQIYDVEALELPHQILAHLLLKKGCFFPNELKQEVLRTTELNYDEKVWPDKERLKIREFYLNDFRKKIEKHNRGMKHCWINLKAKNNKEFDCTIIGYNDLLRKIDDGTIDHYPFINLDCCKLKQFPTELFSLSHIIRLSIEKNMITQIPPEIGNLINLKELYVSDNNIADLPHIITSMFNLEYIGLRNNKVSKDDYPLDFWPPKIKKNILRFKEFLNTS